MKRKQETKKWGFNPETVTAIVLILTFVFSFYIYMEQNKGDIHLVDDSGFTSG